MQVERPSRLVQLARTDAAAAALALAGSSAKLNPIAAQLRQSPTNDQGKVPSRNKELADQTGVKVHSFNPHSPWQRGTFECTNGPLRQYLPKGADLNSFSQAELDAIADRFLESWGFVSRSLHRTRARTGPPRR